MYDYNVAINTVSSTDIRAINRTAILELIRVAGPISRSELAARLHISLPTVMRIVNDLILEKMVRPTNQKQWSGGRRRDLIEFNGSRHLVIGIDLGGTKFYGAVADLTGKILFENHFEHGHTTGEVSFFTLCEALQELVSQASTTGLPILGIAVGVPGITDPVAGTVSVAPSLGWTDFPLKTRLENKFSIPIMVENDVNLAVLGEFWFGTDPGEENVVLISIGTGIGAGILMKGIVYTGSHNIAGEVGYLLPDPAFLQQNFPGFGAFEQIASGTGIAARAQNFLKLNGDHKKDKAISAEEVFSSARSGEKWAQTVLEETVTYLAQAIAAIVLVADPHIILLGGGVTRSADLLLEPIRNHLHGVIPFVPKLAASRLGYQAGVLGGIARILRSTAGYCTVLKYT